MADSNRVRELYRSGRVALGTYVMSPTPAAAEMAAVAGMDFVRMDAYHVPFNPETLHDMVRAVYAHQGVTPAVRVRNDPWSIMMVLDMGTQMITIPNVGSVAEAERAASAAFYPPRGTREMSRPIRMRNLSGADYLAWTNENVVVSCQIEGEEGIRNYREIVKADGVEIIQTGRGDISLALGIPAATMDPRVLEVEQRIIEAALDAGKQAHVMVPLTEQGIEYAQSWIERGVRIVTLDSDYRVLARAYERGLHALRGGPLA